MKFSKLAQFFEKIEATSSRLDITKLLSELFSTMSIDEIEKAAYLLQGRVAPAFTHLEFGMAEKMAIRAVLSALMIERSYFEKINKEKGDIGMTVEYFRRLYSSFEEKDMEIIQVYNELHRMASESGTGSQEMKIHILSSLIRRLDPLSTRFLIRIPLGVMRLGFSDMTMLDSYSWLLIGDKTLRPEIEKAYHVRPDLGYIARCLKSEGISTLKKIGPQVFTPIIMMRAERLSSGQEIIEKIGPCAVEPKYDGFRLQIHYKKIQEGAEVKIYSRNLEEVSFMFPDIVEGVKSAVKGEEVIFEGEAIGFDPLSGGLLPFQETVQRKRKYDIEEKSKEIPLKLFIFELLYSDGISYLEKPFTIRRNKMESSIRATGNIFNDMLLLAPDKIMKEGKKIEQMFDDAIEKGLEGIIAKKLNGIYQPGARGWNWIKFKRSYSSKINDTIDCLVMGYDLGRGKRTGFGIGAFLVGVYDKKNDQYMTVAKIGTGLSDEEWKKLEANSQRVKIKTKPKNYIVDKAMECNIWLNPHIVVEIRADELTRSSVHTAGRVMKSSKSGSALDVDISGFALRFPRLERFRDDKSVHDITTLKEIDSLYKMQEKR